MAAGSNALVAGSSIAASRSLLLGARIPRLCLPASRSGRKAAFGGIVHKAIDFKPLRVLSMSTSQSRKEDVIKNRIQQRPVVVYSKTTCPYCARVKALFSKLGVEIDAIELNEMEDMASVQAALKRLTGQSTVPNVFIGGKHIGGCDDTVRLHNQGKLVPLLTEAGALN